MSSERMQSNKEPIGVWRAAAACALLVACVWFIWSNSMLSSAASSQRSQAVANYLAKVLGGTLGHSNYLVHYVRTHVRKIAHAVEFCALGMTAVVMLTVLRRVNVHTVLHAAFFVLLVALADETIQLFTGRGSQVQDIVLDFAGGVSGIVLLLGARALVRLPGRR